MVERASAKASIALDTTSMILALIIVVLSLFFFIKHHIIPDLGSKNNHSSFNREPVKNKYIGFFHVGDTISCKVSAPATLKLMRDGQAVSSYSTEANKSYRVWFYTSGKLYLDTGSSTLQGNIMIAHRLTLRKLLLLLKKQTTLLFSLVYFPTLFILASVLRKKGLFINELTGKDARVPMKKPGVPMKIDASLPTYRTTEDLIVRVVKDIEATYLNPTKLSNVLRKAIQSRFWDSVDQKAIYSKIKTLEALTAVKQAVVKDEELKQRWRLLGLEEVLGEKKKLAEIAEQEAKIAEHRYTEEKYQVKRTRLRKQQAKKATNRRAKAKKDTKAETRRTELKSASRVHSEDYFGKTFDAEESVEESYDKRVTQTWKEYGRGQITKQERDERLKRLEELKEQALERLRMKQRK